MSKGFAEKLKLLCTLMCAVMVFCALLAACSSDDADVEAEVPAAIGWDYFDNYDPIGKTYEEISGQYGSLEEEGVYDGGVTLRVDGADLYFGFPCCHYHDHRSGGGIPCGDQGGRDYKRKLQFG